MLRKFMYFINAITIMTFILFLPSPKVYAMSNYDVLYEGIDVSHWQEYINYAEVKASGIEIVYIKSSQGSNIVDPYFRTNYNNAKANGLNIGFYHYVVARTEAEAIKEAEYFSSVISGTSPNCKLAMDFENFGNLNNTEINAISRAFLAKVKEITGKDMIIYSDAYNARHTFDKELASSYPLWIAEYGVSSPTENINWESWVRFSIYKFGKNKWNYS